MDIQTVLVMILSIGFGILILFWIVLAFILIKILTAVRRITQKAEDATESLGAATKLIAKKIAPLAVSTAVGAMLKKSRKSKN